MSQFNGKVALITGAASGIGAATAKALAAGGAKVVVSDVQDKLGEQVVAAIEASGGTATYVRCDVSQAEEVEALVQHALEAFGRLDIAVNNAGIEGEQAPTADQSIEAWDRVLSVNLRSTFLCMKAEIPHLLEHEGSAIVNVSSIAGLRGFENAGPYVASKHGIVGLTRAAALEYAKQGLRINALCPGVIDTPMIDRATGGDEAAAAGYAAAEPVGRLGRPEEMADAILWLVSDEASFVTGQAIAADGGWTAR